MQTPSSHAMSPQEIEKLRALLNSVDTENAAKGMKEFDLAKPDVGPYRHQEFPLHLTNKAGKTKIAYDAEQAARFRSKGFLDPHDYRAHVATLPKPDEDDAPEAEEADEAPAENGKSRRNR